MASSAWQKSSYSGASDNCVELRVDSGLVELRESDDSGIVIRSSPANFARFLLAAKAGEFDHHAD
ncbi:DUF397 domain-containing protein [Kitasatospora sp. NPDC056531]|uniref:DUF397 domain-containing protein n=1 Tax=Kitasatospora sp. NPDC056531 TaxID=3345856 RepID=UPI003689C1CB